MRRVLLESDRRFGFRFVKYFLPAEFSDLSLYRVRKLMRELGIRGCTPNVKKRTTIPDPNAKPRPDLVRRDFSSPVPTYKLVGDITYLCTAAHSKAHTRAGEGSGHHSEVRRTTTGYNTVSHPEKDTGRPKSSAVTGNRHSRPMLHKCRRLVR